MTASQSQTISEPAHSQAAEVLAGFRSEPKQIAPKYFYDQKGAQLFDAITELDEYYVTRTEKQIFTDHRKDICAVVGSGANVIEPGAGSCEKIRWLLPELEPAQYTPMDISAEHLEMSAARLGDEYPELEIVAQPCDHTEGLHIEAEDDAPRVFFYPGSSIGNFEPEEAVAFLREMRAGMDAGEKGGLLIGVDAKKDKQVLEAAYDDKAGVTSEFNLNVLDHLNELLGGNLSADNFEHVALYNEARGRIEMHLRCTRSHTAQLAGEEIEFVEGELIHTENSYKYHPDEFAGLAREADFKLADLWQDERGWFSVMYFEPV